MKLFKNLFSRLKGENNIAFLPTIGLNLEYYPTPENASKLADIFVSSALSIDKISLDYSIDSLKYVDNFLQRFSNEGLSVNNFGKAIFRSGCYVGEVMVRNRNGIWVDQKEIPLPPEISTQPIIIKLSTTQFCDPITKAFKRFYFGESDSIQYFYEIFTNRDTR
jgi:hypothetical protein